MQTRHISSYLTCNIHHTYKHYLHKYALYPNLLREKVSPVYLLVILIEEN